MRRNVFILQAGWIVVGLLAVLLSTGTIAAATSRLKLSGNQRFLVYEDGRPFFYLGDTAWEMFHRLTREEAEKYLRNRAAKQFTVIQAVVLAELDGLHDPNAHGQTPLRNDDPLQPNEEYFQHVDWIVNKANELGLFIGMLPTWGDKWNKGSWGAGPEIFNPQSAEIYGQWLANRYRDAGIIWILGGDRGVDNDRQKDIIRALAKGLQKGDNGAHLITFHPPGGSGSSKWFHDELWLNFNMRQNGHVVEFTGRYDQTKADYDRTPIKPVLDGEPIYEDHPVSFDAQKLGHSVAADVRRPLYWDLFNGACGHTYGHHSVWQMFDPAKRKPINNPLMPWYEAIDQPGAGQMQFGRKLIESRPFLTRIPDQSLIVTEKVSTSVPGTGTRHFAATRDEEGTYGMVYTPVGRPFAVQLDRLNAKSIKAWWFNPRNGTAEEIATMPCIGQHQFTPPDKGELLDWVLVLDDAAKSYPAPGSKPFVSR